MKEKYIYLKKKIRSYLGLGTTLGLIGIFCLFSNMMLFGIVSLLIGLFFLCVSANYKKKSMMIENSCKEKCIICNDEIIYSNETRYYINDNLVEEEVYCQHINNKKRMEINYYKCEKCKFCLTVIHTFVTIRNKEKKLNDKINMDFNYEGNY